MTPEDKRLIAEYMGWYDVMVEDPMNKGVMEKIITKHNHAEAYFDLNDAGLCVQEMQKRGEFHSFLMMDTFNQISSWSDFIAYLFNAESFFNAMSEWLKERG